MRAISFLLIFTPCLACSSEVSSRSESAESTKTGEESRPITDASNLELDKYKLEIREKLPQVARINVEELAARLRNHDAPLLLDVRAAEEYAVSHLVGAKRAATVAEALAVLEGVPEDREIVVYCSIGYRSGHLADELQGQGYTNVRNLEGSIFEWANTGHAVYRGEQLVHVVHPYDDTWGRLLDRELWSEDG